MMLLRIIIHLVCVCFAQLDGWCAQTHLVASYATLQHTWEEAIDVARDTETKVRKGGVSAQITKFDFLFDMILGEMLLCHSDNLSKTLQNKSISAAEGR